MFEIKVTPRFGDVDGLRHVNNCVVPAWFELGRAPFFQFFNPDMDLGNWNLIMARIVVDFHSQMRLGADVAIRTAVKKVGTSSFTVYQEAWQNGVLGASGEAVVVHFDFARQKTSPIPPETKEQLKKHLVTAGRPACVR